MAWTRSAQRGGACALNFQIAARDAGAWLEHARHGAAPAPRTALVLVAAALTAAGLVLPLLSIDTLAALLFFAGALFAAFALRPPFPASPPPAQARIATVAKTETRFAELLSGADRGAQIDRAAWARLTAHMSHELRTPLNAVLGFSELMSNEVFGPMGASCYSDYARDIHASGRRLLKSAEDALAITALLTAPPSQGPPPSSRLSTSLSDALAFHAAILAELGVAVTVDVSGDDAILADAQTVRQLLINLVAECLERAGENAKLVVGARTDGAETRAVVAITGVKTSAQPPADAFNLQLARTLAELSGARIAEAREAEGQLEFVVEFTAAAQRDFFYAA